MKIHIIGNSHVNTFSGYPYLSRDKSKGDRFVLHHMGAVTARYMHKVHSGSLAHYLKTVNKETDYVILMAGEVDCRFHIPLQADRKKTSDGAMTEIFIKGFMEAIDFVSSQGYKQIVFGCHPSTTEDHNMSKLDRPIYGSPERRNNIALIWNELLELESLKRDLPYFDIYKHLTDNNNRTNMDYFIDYCHLNSEMVMGYILFELSLIDKLL